MFTANNTKPTSSELSLSAAQYQTVEKLREMLRLNQGRIAKSLPVIEAKKRPMFVYDDFIGKDKTFLEDFSGSHIAVIVTDDGVVDFEIQRAVTPAARKLEGRIVSMFGERMKDHPMFLTLILPVKPL